jgi:hypothetical protein
MPLVVSVGTPNDFVMATFGCVSRWLPTKSKK